MASREPEWPGGCCEHATPLGRGREGTDGVAHQEGDPMAARRERGSTLVNERWSRGSGEQRQHLGMLLDLLQRKKWQLGELSPAAAQRGNKRRWRQLIGNGNADGDAAVYKRLRLK
jgi:hypothetical protein